MAVVYKVADAEEAIELANGPAYGLGGAVFSADQATAQSVADRLEAGMVWINSPNGTQADLPFGGVKRSGVGRELARYGMDEFINKKLIRPVSRSSTQEQNVFQGLAFGDPAQYCRLGPVRFEGLRNDGGSHLGCQDHHAVRVCQDKVTRRDGDSADADRDAEPRPAGSQSLRGQAGAAARKYRQRRSTSGAVELHDAIEPRDVGYRAVDQDPRGTPGTGCRHRDGADRCVDPVPSHVQDQHLTRQQPEDPLVDGRRIRIRNQGRGCGPYHPSAVDH